MAIQKTDIKLVPIIDESLICDYWLDEKIFEQTLSEDKEDYIFYDGPPFATGLPHYGHILAGFIKDSIIRYQTQNNKSVPRRAGWDTHGLPIEYEIEKKYNIKTKKQILEWGISNYNSACRHIVMEYASEWKTIMNRLGRWIDFDNDYKTLDFDFMNSVWWVFNQLSIKNLIYPSYRVMPYSVACTTALSNFEIQQNYQEVEDQTLIVCFKLKPNSLILSDSDTYLLVWTTTPWTLPSNIAIAINNIIEYSLVEYDLNYYILSSNLILKVFGKKDYKIIKKIDGINLIGLHYEPLFNSYPIDKLDINISLTFSIINGDFVTDTDGTGLVHIAPSYGEDDYQVCIKNSIIKKTDMLFMSIDEEGYFIKDLDDLSILGGVFYKPQGNNIIIKLLTDSNKIFSQSKYKHSYPFCWRSDTPIMYRAMKSWFVNVESIKERMVELNKTINWVPSNIGSGRFHNWIANAKDWCIARTRYWGTPIPIWQNINDETDYIFIQSANQLEILCGLEQSTIKDLHRDKIDHLTFIKNGNMYKRIDDVFDCWFESGSMPYASIGYPYITSSIKIPADFIAEGIDQTRGWFYTLLVISTAIFDVAPFKNVIVNGLILASDGKKMSKRLKNYPDPMDVVNKYGSDALRLYLLGSNATKGDILKFNENGVHSIVRDIIIPLKNSLKFFKEYEQKYKLDMNDDKLYTNLDYQTDNILDLYVIKYISLMIMQLNNDLKMYQLADAVRKIYYIIELLNNTYIKFNRHSLKGKNPNWKSSLSVLGMILKYIAINVAPLMPFFAEYMFKQLDKTSTSIHLIQYSNKIYYLPILSIEQSNLADNMQHIINIIKQVFSVRSKNNISMKTPINKLLIKTSTNIIELIKLYSNFILDELNILSIEIDTFDWANINIDIRPNFPIIKQTYSNIEHIKLIINTINKDRCLKQYLAQNIDVKLDNIIIKQQMLDILIKPEPIINYVSEYNFIDGYNYCVYIDIIQTEQIKQLAYGKLISTLFQRMRKNAGLHPWDPINLGLYGNTEYSFDKISEQIYSICMIKPIKLDNICVCPIYTYTMAEYMEDCSYDLILYLF